MQNDTKYNNKSYDKVHKFNRPSGRSNKEILINGKSKGSHALIFVDTGSTISLVSPKFLEKLDVLDNIQPDNTKLSSFSNDMVRTIGRINLQLEIAGDVFEHTFIVSCLVEHDFLIGMDIMSQRMLTIDIGHKIIKSKFGISYFIKVPKSVDRTSKVTCKKNTTLKPNSMSNIELSVKNNRNGTLEGIFEPYLNFITSTGILIKPSWIYASNRTFMLRCINLTEHPVTLYKNKFVGSLEPIKFQKFGHVNKITTSESCIEENTRSKWQNIEELYDQLKVDEMPITIKEKDRLKSIVDKYSQCFSTGPYDLGRCTIYTAEIKVKPDATPVWIPSRKIPYNLQQQMDLEIQNMEKSGMIKPCKFSLWNSACFLVSKKAINNDNNNSSSKNKDNLNNNIKPRMRFVQDCRSINKASIDDKYELTNLNHILDKITENRYLSTFDFVSSFTQIPLSEESQPITAFSYNGARYMFQRLVMGHKTSSSQWSRLMARLFNKIPFKNLIWFIDDILLCSNTVEDHLDRFEYMLNRLSYANLKLSPKKCNMLRNELSFVGMTISKNGISIDKDRIKAMTNLKPPTNVKETQRIIGLFSYNRKFIKNFATISRPLYDLLKKKGPFEWSSNCQSAFEKLIELITNAAILCLPDINKPFQISVDASSLGFGGILQQKDPDSGSMKTIAYFSRSVPKHQRHWHASKLEFLAMHACLMHWRLYTQGPKKVVVQTDCRALINFDTIFSRGNNAAMQRKIADLAGFNLEIRHISGESNVVCDALSRYGHNIPTKNKFTQTGNSEKISKIAIPKVTDEVIALKRIKNSQKEDFLISELKSWIEAKERPNSVQEIDAPLELVYYWRNYDKFFIKDDIVWYRWRSRKKLDPESVDSLDSAEKHLIVVPQSLYDIVIRQYHEGVQNCHSGIENSLNACRKYFWWYKQRNEFEYYIKSCTKCNEVKQPRKSIIGPLKPVIFRAFNQGIAIDHLCPGDDLVTLRGNRYILTITCLFTGYLVACPVKTQKSPETIKMILNNWITTFGWPLAILHDMHKNFTSELFSTVMTIFDIDDRHSTSYHSQSNGKVESQNKRINTAMRASLTDSQMKNWDIWLPYIVFTLNSLKSARTGHSSNMLVFGRDLRAPRDLWMSKHEIEKFDEPYVNIDNLKKKYAYDLHRIIGQIMNKVQKTMNKHVSLMCKQFNKNVTGPFFEVGQWCYTKINVPSNKFSARWTGPWKIVHKISDNVYVVVVNHKECIVNVTKMKAYQPSKYFPLKKDVGIQTGTNLKSTSNITTCTQPNTIPDKTDNYYDDDDDDELVFVYRPISGSNGFSNSDRLQRHINQASPSGPVAGQPSTLNNANVATANTNGSTSTTSTTTQNSSQNNAANNTNNTSASSWIRHNPRPQRVRNPIERLKYPHDHAEANKRWRK